MPLALDPRFHADVRLHAYTQYVVEHPFDAQVLLCSKVLVIQNFRKGFDLEMRFGLDPRLMEEIILHEYFEDVADNLSNAQVLLCDKVLVFQNFRNVSTLKCNSDSISARGKKHLFSNALHTLWKICPML